MLFDNSPQGSDEWIEARRAVITGSRFGDARDRTAKGLPSAKCLQYAMDVARERCGGLVPQPYINNAMRTGTEQEPLARQAYEAKTGNIVEEVGFAFTEDRKFGCSVDGLIDSDGVWECKTMVSSQTLFKAVVDGDISDYRDQIVGCLWLLGRKWCDLVLWAPDLPKQRMTIIRITRDENEIQALEDDMVAFEQLVSQYEDRLRSVLTGERPVDAKEVVRQEPPAPQPAAPTVVTPSTLPASIF